MLIKIEGNDKTGDREMTGRKDATPTDNNETGLEGGERRAKEKKEELREKEERVGIEEE